LAEQLSSTLESFAG